MHHRTSGRGPLLALVAAALVAAALVPAAHAQIGTLATVGGEVTDLSVDGSGRLLYCTTQSKIGRINPANGNEVVLSAAGTIPSALRGIAETPAGDVAVIDGGGDIWSLPGGTGPAVEIYSDLFIIKAPTDLLVDATGNFLTVSDTPSTGWRAFDWVSPDGANWCYYLVDHQPLALAADPLTGDVLFTDLANGGSLRRIERVDQSHPTSIIDATTQPGFTLSANDGDIAMEADGDALFVAGGTVWRHDRSAGTTATIATGLGQLRAIAIAASSGAVPSASGFSAYVAEGSSPTMIREIGNVGAPAALRPPSLGTVPDRGTQLVFFIDVRVFDLAADKQGNLLVGGDVFGSSPSVRRVDLSTLHVSLVAGPNDGIGGKIEGVHVGGNGRIYACTRFGVVYEIEEGPTQVTELFSNSQGQITVSKDIVHDRDGTMYLANRSNFCCGDVVQLLANGTLGYFVPLAEARGLCSDPFTSNLLVSEWVGTGFLSAVRRMDTLAPSLAPIPSFDGLNLSNAEGWADGEMAMDCLGNVYLAVEDEFGVVRFDTKTGKLYRVSSGYTQHVSGVAIAPSTPGSGSTTGWSLYVTEFIRLFEIPSVAAPAPTIPDRNAPPIGDCVGYLSSTVGTPRAMIDDPAGGGFLVATSGGTVERVDLLTGAATQYADSGGANDLVAIASDSNGVVHVVTAGGVVSSIHPTTKAFTTVFADGANALGDVRGMAIDGLDRVYVVERDAGSPAGRVLRINGAALEPVAIANRGVRPEVDPLTGELWVSSQGSVQEGAGEILRARIDGQVAYGHWRGDTYYAFDVGPTDGDLAFDAAGNVWVAAGDAGRVARVDRASGARSVFAGNYDRPAALTVSFGRPAIAGAQGASLFVLDGWAIYEHGIPGAVPPPPATNPPGLAPPAELRVEGFATLGALTPVVLDVPADAGKVYILLPTASGKTPVLPLTLIGNPSDPRVLPWTYDVLFDYLTSGFLPGFIGILDGAGKSLPGTGVFLPNDPALVGLDLFVDMTWMTFDPFVINGVANVGGTAHLFFGT